MDEGSAVEISRSFVTTLDSSNDMVVPSPLGIGLQSGTGESVVVADDMGGIITPYGVREAIIVNDGESEGLVRMEGIVGSGEAIAVSIVSCLHTGVEGQAV